MGRIYSDASKKDRTINLQKQKECWKKGRKDRGE